MRQELCYLVPLPLPYTHPQRGEALQASTLQECGHQLIHPLKYQPTYRTYPSYSGTGTLQQPKTFISIVTYRYVNLMKGGRYLPTVLVHYPYLGLVEATALGSL